MRVRGGFEEGGFVKHERDVLAGGVTQRARVAGEKEDRSALTEGDGFAAFLGDHAIDLGLRELGVLRPEDVALLIDPIGKARLAIDGVFGLLNVQEQAANP